MNALVARNTMKGNRIDQMTPHQRERSLLTLALYLEGKRWKDIPDLGGYPFPAFARMMAEFPDLGHAFKEARANSAYMLEDKALQLAADLVAQNDFSGTQVRAHEVAMNQYRWSASRRSEDFADKGAGAGLGTIPIQINTTLNLQAGADDTQIQSTVYEAHALIAKQAVEAPPEAEDYPEVESATEDAEASPVPPLEALANELGLPEVVEKAIKQRRSTGRPLKGHKSAMLAGKTAQLYSIKKKSPAVRRALGLPTTEEEDHGLVIDAGNKPPRAGE